jgi:DNA polymerase I-like protein with 3'-5' exonuclease and polymerase domains
MLINCDVKSLEVVVAADRYRDAVLQDELIRKLDLHALNQAKFKLPDRVTAKRFIFKLLYGASAFGYAMDSDFIGVGYSQRRWQKVIDAFYEKYTGVGKGHQLDTEYVMKNGYLEIPSGRYFNYKLFTPEWGGPAKWPITKIKNYPIQGFGADLVMLARVEFFKQFKRSGLEGHFICTVHDSLVADVPSKNVEQTAAMMAASVAKIPEMCYNNWSYKFSLPVTSEILVGPNKRDMVELKL